MSERAMILTSGTELTHSTIPLVEWQMDRVQVDELYTFVKERGSTSAATSRTLIPSERSSSGEP
ncbi:MAG: hypothetical protein ACE5OS_07565 [Anaerolineae bacterium]